MESTAQRLEIVTWPNRVLRTPCEKVTSFGEDLREFSENLIKTLHYEGGVGLAANQVGDNRRLFVADFDKQERTTVLVNPVIEEFKDPLVNSNEGCLSLPGITAYVREVRYSKIAVSAYDLDEKPFQLRLADLNALIVQHEMDHLDGICMLDRLPRIKKAMLEKRYKRLLKRKAERLRNMKIH